MPREKKKDPFTFDTEYSKVGADLNCTNKSDKLQLVLATGRGKPGHAGMFQKSAYCTVVPNRCFRKLCEFKGDTVPVFSALVSDIADLPKPELWQLLTFESQQVLFDKYSVTLTLGSGCVVKKWLPDGMEEEQNELPGIELHFVTNGEEDFEPMGGSPLRTVPRVLTLTFADTAKIQSIAETHRQHAIKAYEEIQAMQPQ